MRDLLLDMSGFFIYQSNILICIIDFLDAGIQFSSINQCG